MSKFSAADIDGQNTDWYAEVEDDSGVPGHVLISIWEEQYAGLYLEPAAARGLAAALIDYANKVEY